MGKNNPTLLVSFGGPRSLEEVAPFLKELLCDQKMVRTGLPTGFHRALFSLVARVRASKLRSDYAWIGGRSAIFEDTERLAHMLEGEAIPFYRYLPATHGAFLKRMESLSAPRVRVFPLYPQQSSVTTGSAQQWLCAHLSEGVIRRLSWIDSYADHPAFIGAWQGQIREFLEKNNLQEGEVVLLFSAHGVPQKLVDEGDPYAQECLNSFKAIVRLFPQALSKLSFQSKFGFGRWVQPATQAVCEEVLSWSHGRKHVVLVPLSFTSDHIETLFEIERLYLPLIGKRGLQGYRCPALGTHPRWAAAIQQILSM